MPRTMKATLLEPLETVQKFLVAKGMTGAAKHIDLVANTIEDPRVRIAVVPDTEPGNPSDEASRLDKFQVSAADMHKYPVGANNVDGEVFGKTNAEDYNPSFASEQPIHIQAHSNRTAENVDLQDLTERKLDKDIYDLGDAGDDFSTGALPAEGHDPAIDDDQEGGTLEAFGTQPEGSLHAAVRGTSTKASRAKSILVAAVNNGLMSKREANARWAKVRQAIGNEMNLAPTTTENPNTMDKDTGFATAQTLPPDQKRASRILAQFPAPKHLVPPAMNHAWARAVEQTHQAGKLFTASNGKRRANLGQVLTTYRTMLRDLADVATV